MTSRTLITTLLGVLACASLVAGCQDNLLLQVEATTTPTVNANVIRVWSVGSPYSNDLPAATVPRELQRCAESLGYTIEIKSFRPIGFAEKFRKALLEHNEPEVLAFGYYGVLSGMNTGNGFVEGVASDARTASLLFLVHESLASLRERVVLVRSAINYEAARALSMQSLVSETKTVQITLREAHDTAASAARAYLACDQSTLSVISDESRLGQKCFMPESDTQVESVRVTRISGNRNLAVVSLVTTFSSQVRESLSHPGLVQGGDLGQQSILSVLRNRNGVWRLLAITDDPVNTVVERPFTRPSFESSLDDGLTTAVAPDAARLLTVDGVYPRPQKGERFGDFLWQPSESKDVIVQVVEFMFDRYSNRQGTRLFFLPANADKLSTGSIWSGGATLWRVWSISKSGDVGFSEQRSFIH